MEQQQPSQELTTRNDAAVMQASFAAMSEDVTNSGNSNGFALRPRLSKGIVEELYRIPIFGRICSAKPSSAILKGWQITLGDEKNSKSKVPGAYNKYSKKLKLPQKFCSAQVLANIYGGAVLLINADDGQHWSKPLSKKSLKTIKSLIVLDRYKIQPSLEGTLALLDPTEPEYYQLLLPLQENKDVSDNKVHHSRVIRFDGIPLPPDVMLQQESGWGMSLIEAIYTDWDNWSRGLTATVRMLEDFSLFIYKMAQLKELIAEEDQELITARIRTLRQGIKAVGGAVIDANGEDIAFANRQFGGIDAVSDKLRDAFIGSTGMPHDRLFGESPSGLGATGESEEKNWAAEVATFQESEWREKLEYLVEIIFACQDGPTGGKEIEDLGLNFIPLRQETMQEIISNRSTQAQTDNTYFQMGALLPEEIRNTRFSGSEYNFETNLDQKLWDEAKKQQQQQEQFSGFEDFGGGEEAPTEEPIAPEELPTEEEPPLTQDSLVSDDTAQTLVDKGVDRSSPVFAELLEQTASWVKTKGSYKALEQDLPELFDKLDSDKFAEVLFEQMLVAQLAGMAEVQE